MIAICYQNCPIMPLANEATTGLSMEIHTYNINSSEQLKQQYCAILNLQTEPLPGNQLQYAQWSKRTGNTYKNLCLCSPECGSPTNRCAMPGPVPQ